MGSMAEARCDCGFEKRLSLGGGMHNFLTNCSFPCYCSDCKSMFSANLYSESLVCAKCSSQNVLAYDDDSLRIKTPDLEPELLPIRYRAQTLWEKILRRKPEMIQEYYQPTKNIFDWNSSDILDRNPALTYEDYFCPSCEKFSMKFYIVGCWD